jgi:hypothetical protein
VAGLFGDSAARALDAPTRKSALTVRGERARERHPGKGKEAKRRPKAKWRSCEKVEKEGARERKWSRQVRLVPKETKGERKERVGESLPATLVGDPKRREPNRAVCAVCVRAVCVCVYKRRREGEKERRREREREREE